MLSVYSFDAKFDGFLRPWFGVVAIDSSGPGFLT